MQNDHSLNRSKKILYIVLSILLVAGAAFATVYMLSRTLENSSVKTPSEVSLPDKLSKLYKDSSGDQNGSLSNLVVQKSGTGGYNNAHAKISGTESSSGSSAYFYQTPDSNWHFFEVAKNQNLVACSDYNSDDLVNAFIGFTCLDTTNNVSSFVAHPQPVFNEADMQPGDSGG